MRFPVRMREIFENLLIIFYVFPPKVRFLQISKPWYTINLLLLHNFYIALNLDVPKLVDFYIIYEKLL